VSKIKLTIYILTFFLGLTLASSVSAVYPVARLLRFASPHRYAKRCWRAKHFGQAGRRKIRTRGIILYALVLLGTFFVLKPAYGAITIRPALNLGLVGYWSMDEGSGTAVNDQSGNRNTGTVYSSTTPAANWVDGKMGKALDFDGSDDYVSINSNSTHQITGDISFGAWFRADSVVDKKRIIEEGNDISETEANNQLYVLRWDTTSGNDLEYKHEYGAGTDQTSAFDTNLSTGQWYYAILVRTVADNTVKLYLNGTYHSSITYTNDPTGGTSSGLYFGATDTALDSFDGIIDEVRIYNRALSAVEIKRLFNITKPSIKTPTNLGLVGYWSFDEGLGVRAGDMSGMGNNGIFAVGNDPPSWTTGKRGGALQFTASVFDQDNPWVDLGTNFNVSLPFTLSAWINPVNNYSYPTIISKRDSFVNSDMRFSLQLDSGGGSEGQVRFQGNTASTRLFDYVPPLNIWTQVTVIAQAGSTVLYINGVLMQSLSGVTLGTDNAARVGIGRNGETTSDNDAFHGKLDEVRVYNRALSVAEIQTLYNGSKKIMRVNVAQNNQLTSGLVGFWTFNAPDIYGATTTDISGNGNNGLIYGTTVTPGKVGQALSFNGTSNHHVDLNSTPLINSTQPFTVSYWSKVNAISNYIIPLTLRTETAQNWRTYYTAGSNNVDFGGGGPPIWGRFYATLTGSPMNNWRHAVITYNGSGKDTMANYKFYDNGVSVSLTTTSGFAGDTGNSRIGGYTGANEWWWNGSIDEVRVYNRALSADEIKRLYQMGK